MAAEQFSPSEWLEAKDELRTSLAAEGVLTEEEARAVPFDVFLEAAMRLDAQAA